MRKKLTDKEKKILKKFGSNLLKTIMSKGETVSSVSKISGISQDYIRKMTWGEENPSLVIIVRLCNALNIDVYDLYDFRKGIINDETC